MSLTEILTLLSVIVAIAAGIIIPIIKSRSGRRRRDLEKLNDLSSHITKWWDALVALDIHDRPVVQAFDKRATFEEGLRDRLDTLGRSRYPSIIEKAEALRTEALRYKGELRPLPSLESAKNDLQSEISRFRRELS